MASKLYPALAAGLILSACASGRGPPPPPPPPTGPVRALDTTPPPAAAASPYRPPSHPVPAGTSCRYCVTNEPGRRQYFDQRRKRYYFFDRIKKGYYWENGDPKL